MLYIGESMTILSELHQDHVNLSKLLVILRLKAQNLREGSQPNFHLIADVIDYITNYADGYHHPREDELYKYYMGMSDALDSHLKQGAEEHAALKVATAELREAVDGVLHDTVRPMGDISDLLDGFVSQQLSHLSTEEGMLFPMIEELATDNDWEIIKTMLPNQADPLFGAKQAEKYTDLYRELIVDMNNR